MCFDHSVSIPELIMIGDYVRFQIIQIESDDQCPSNAVDEVLDDTAAIQNHRSSLCYNNILAWYNKVLYDMIPLLSPGYPFVGFVIFELFLYLQF